jgi:hypothetical protein
MEQMSKQKLQRVDEKEKEKGKGMKSGEEKALICHSLSTRLAMFDV